MVGASGFESPTSWSRTKNSKISNTVATGMRVPRNTHAPPASPARFPLPGTETNRVLPSESSPLIQVD
jgi:hypothetical protein